MMNKLFQITLSLLFVVIASVSYGHENLPVPPDTTTSVVDKAAALVIIEQGKTMYGAGKIKDALIKFREAGVKDPNSWRAAYWIGKCHYRMNSYGYALQYAQKAVALGGDKVNDEIYFSLAQAYHRVGEIDSALVNYQMALKKLSKIRSNELLVQHHVDECNFALEQLKTEAKFKKVRAEGTINSGYDDYNAIIAGDGKTMYFVGRRSNTTGGGMNPDDQRFFEDTYRATWDDDMLEWDDVTNDLGKINSVGFDALNYISPDGLYGVMTLNTTASGMKKTTRGSDLCELKLSDKKTWNTPKIIKNKSINTSFFEGSATLTADAQTMYFVSDRKGERSSTDIYVVHRLGEKSWGEAKPLPMTVNTRGRETTPYITPDGRYLFFSSDGHTGMGGLDVYVVENLGDGWGTPINLGNGINSVNNDTHFTYYAEMKKAFMAGYEIVGQKSSIDIYEVDMTDFVFPKQ
ncbi:MAG: hypothetical protein QNK23_04080 [Crocinitomicaceae bacterium]|nr:hypothetical protein [Crocinitomicaceae bacterium]